MQAITSKTSAIALATIATAIACRAAAMPSALVFLLIRAVRLVASRVRDYISLVSLL